MMSPVGATMAENIVRHCERVADEVARRCAADHNAAWTTPAIVRQHVLAVLIDWLLGDAPDPPPPAA
jgi:hypothetical protein